jgi:hypothetical protein
MPLRPSTPTTTAAAATAPHGPGHGIRAGLLHLLPRHTLFHARLVVHGLTNVPLVRGEFGVKWKFAKVQAHPHPGGLLAKMAIRKGSGAAAASHHHLPEHKLKGKAKEVEAYDEEPVRAGEEHLAPGAGLGGLVINVVQPTPDSAHPPLSPRPSSSADSFREPRPSTDPSASSLSLAPEPAAAAGAETSAFSSTERGMTPYGPLAEHAVYWEHTVDVIVQMGLSRDTSELLPNELKLQVLQVRRCCLLRDRTTF